jgi:metallo-beta-lactamase family protein
MVGRYVPVRAEVVDIGGFSVHADASEIVAWLSALEDTPPAMTFVVHGEVGAAAMMRDRIRGELRWRATVPEHLERVRLD